MWPLNIGLMKLSMKLNDVPEGQQHRQDQEDQFFLENPEK